MLLNSLTQWSLWWSCNFGATNKRNQINAILWFCLFFAITFQLYAKLIRPYLRALNIAHYKWKLSIRYTWNVTFFAVAIIFLCIYQKYYLADSLYFKQNGQNYYRSYENLLFYTSSNQQHQRCSPFNAINLILLSFYIVDALYNLNERAYGDAINKFVAASILVCFDQSRLEYFSVTFNILFGFINLMDDILTLVCWHTSPKNVYLYRVCMSLKLFAWSYIFLNLLPFKFLIPTLYGRKFHLGLNCFLWLWYGSSVWNSFAARETKILIIVKFRPVLPQPILQYFYHQIYHMHRNNTECVGSVSRCILIKETNDLRHFKNLEAALGEILLTEKKNSKTEDSSSTKAYQTIKCMIALKRKLKRIRENKGRSSTDD